MGKNLNNDSDERTELNPRLKVSSLFKGETNSYAHQF
jgi:hypothetical protein